MNTAANTNNTIPNVPLMTCVKYRIAIMIAAENLISLSALPIFCFIKLKFIKQSYKQYIFVLVTYVTVLSSIVFDFDKAVVFYRFLIF